MIDRMCVVLPFVTSFMIADVVQCGFKLFCWQSLLRVRISHLSRVQSDEPDDRYILADAVVVVPDVVMFPCGVPFRCSQIQM